MNLITVILRGLLQGDLDAAGYRILNLDTSNLDLGSFGPQAPSTIFAGPFGDVPNAPPSFRTIGPSEVGAQPAASALTVLSTVTPADTGLSILELDAPDAVSYIQVAADGTASFIDRPGLRSDINAETHTDTLTLLGGLTTSASGRKLLTMPDHGLGNAEYLKIGPAPDYDITTLSPGQVLLDLGAGAPFIDSTAIIKGSLDATKLFRIEVDGFTTGTTRIMTPPNYNFTPASISGAEALLNKVVNGATLKVSTAASGDIGDAPVDTPTPAFPHILNLVSVGYSGFSLNIRTTAATDIVLPHTGVLATVAGTIPWSYLSTDKELGSRSMASDALVPTQKAVKTYVDAHTGVKPDTDDGDNIVADTSIDLTDTDAYSIKVTGAADIESITLDEGDEKALIFDSDVTLVAGTFLQTVGGGGKDMLIAAGDYVIARGLAGGVVEILAGQKDGGFKTSAFDTILMNSGGQITHAQPGVTAKNFEIGRVPVGMVPSDFLKFDSEGGVSIIKNDESGGVTFDTSLLTNVQVLQFPDAAGVLGVYVSTPPASALASGTAGQWSSDSTNFYFYDPNHNLWGQIPANYSWP